MGIERRCGDARRRRGEARCEEQERTDALAYRRGRRLRGCRARSTADRGTAAPVDGRARAEGRIVRVMTAALIAVLMLAGSGAGAEADPVCHPERARSARSAAALYDCTARRGAWANRIAPSSDWTPASGRGRASTAAGFETVPVCSLADDVVLRPPADGEPAPLPAPVVEKPPALGRLILDVQPATAQVFADGYYVGVPEDFSIAREAGYSRQDRIVST